MTTPEFISPSTYYKLKRPNQPAIETQRLTYNTTIIINQTCLQAIVYNYQQQVYKTTNLLFKTRQYRSH